MYRKSFEVVGYAYEAAIHCVECAEKRFGAAALADGTAVDSEGNAVTAVFLDGIGDDESCDDCFCTIE